MNDTLTVGELIYKLKEFNPNALVYIHANNHLMNIEDNCFSWYGGDVSESERNISEEKQKTNEVFIYLENTNNDNYDRLKK